MKVWIVRDEAWACEFSTVDGVFLVKAEADEAASLLSMEVEEYEVDTIDSFKARFSERIKARAKRKSTNKKKKKEPQPYTPGPPTVKIPKGWPSPEFLSVAERMRDDIGMDALSREHPEIARFLQPKLDSP